jgi:hypothetical protein
MATTLTLTPLPADAAVRVQVTTTGSSSPVTVVSESAAAIKAGSAWAGSWTTKTLYGDLVAFYSVSANGTATRDSTGLTVGKRYRADLRVELTDVATSIRLGPVGAGLATFGVVPAGSGRATISVEWVATSTSARFQLDTKSNNLPMVESYKLTQLPDGFVFSLARSDRNGTAPVRLEEGQELVGGSLIVTDYEAALSGPVNYIVTTTETVTSSTALNLDEMWLTVPELPQFGRRVDGVQLRHGRPSASTLHEPIDRADPILTVSKLGTRRGQLVMYAATYDDAQLLVECYAQGVCVMLRQPYLNGADVYHVATPGGEVAVDPVGGDYSSWQVTVPFVELARPTGPQLGALAWTYGDGLARNSTYALDAAEFPTYAARVVGP